MCGEVPAQAPGSQYLNKTYLWLAGSYAINPVNGVEIPIWVADYVLGSYGSGCIMAVPAHDTRDYEFAQRFGLPIVRVVEGGDLPFTGNGLAVNSSNINTGLELFSRLKGLFSALMWSSFVLTLFSYD